MAEIIPTVAYTIPLTNLEQGFVKEEKNCDFTPEVYSLEFISSIYS